MLLIVNNLHEKWITESQDGLHFYNMCAICNLHQLQLCTCVNILQSNYMKNALIFHHSDAQDFSKYIII